MTEKKTTTKRTKTALAAGAMAIAGGSLNLAMGQTGSTVKIGLIGCGGRGTGAVGDSMKADPGVEIHAVADLFEAKAKGAAQNFKRRYKERSKIKDDHVFWGFDAYKKLVASNLDIVLMATPPGFRPYHLMAAIKAGKNVFMEKPVAVCPSGARMVMEAAKLAEQKGLGITCGTQRRHARNYMETMKRIHDGQIGELVGGQCYWMGGGIWYRTPVEGMSELEWQCHNWYHWVWLSGDQLCEQHIHNIDVLNWCYNGPPKSFLGMGGRQARDYSAQAAKASQMLHGNDKFTKQYEGNIWCHVGTEMTYPNGARVLSMGRHAKASTRVSERIVGTKGTSNCAGSIEGEKPWRLQGRGTNGRTEEHAVLIEGMKKGKPVNEGQRIAESTLTAIGCRVSAFTGREISWDWLLKKSQLNLLPPEMEAGLKPGPGHFPPIAVPGVTKLI